MTNKLTPEEIKKALEYLPDRILTETERTAIEDALALINRQQAEIERLLQKLQQPQSEAIKEFAEKLQEKADDIGIDEDGFLFTISAEWKTWFRVGDWCEEIIDNLVKEMAGDDK